MSLRRKSLLFVSMLIFIITIFGNTPRAVAGVNPTQNLNSNWITDAANGFAPPNASDTLDSDDGTIWINNSSTSGQWIEFLADPNEGLSSFDLTSLTLGKYQTSSAQELIFTIVGTRTDSSTTPPVNFSWAADDGNIKAFSGAEFAGFTGLTKFKVSIEAGSFTTWNVEFKGFTIDNQVAAANAAPLITNLNDVTFQENTVNAAGQQIDADITVTDSDSADFEGGQVTVSYTTAGLAEDQLAVGNIGNIAVAGGAVSCSGIQIGTVSGGTNGSDLVVILNASATPDRVTELLRALTYGNTSDEPTSYHTISITVSDGDGGIRAPATARIGVTGQGEGGLENPALTQDLNYPDWADNLNNGFVITPNGGVTLDGDGSFIWLDVNNAGPASLTISPAEQFEGGMFDLAGIVFDLHAEGSTFTITVTGHKAGGGTVTAEVTGGSEAEFNGIDLSNMRELAFFDVQFERISGTHGVAYLGLDSFTIANPQEYIGNQEPSISGLEGSNFQENTVNAAGQQIDADIAVADSDSADFDGGQVTVSYTVAGLAEDQLAVGNIGNIAVAGGAVSCSGIQIGTVSGGTNGSDLVIILNSNATVERVTELLRALTYGNASDEPTSYRTISITVSDGDGATSTAATAKIAVSGQGDGGVDSPALTQDLNYPDWRDDLNNGFIITPNGIVTLNGDGTSIWMSGGGVGPASLTISAAEQFEGGMFDLAGIVFDLYNTGDTFTVTVTGRRAGGGTVEAEVTGGSEAEFNGINLSSMTQITSFDVQIVRTSGSHGVDYLGLDSFTIANPQAANLPPVFHSAAAFSVSEAAQADNTVLHDVEAGDGEGGPNDANLSYSIIGGTGSSYFAINSSTGEIKLTAAGEGSLDFEGDSSYTLTVRADDGQAVNNISDQEITVNINDVAPVITAGQSFSISETADNGDVVGTVATTGDDSVSFAIIGGNSGSAFAISSANGEITVNNAGAIDYENASSFTLTIEATDGTSTSSQDVVVNISDVAPVITAGQSFSISETADNGDVVGTVATTGDDSVSFAIIGGNSGSAFAISSANGEITVNNAGAIDYENASSHTLTIEATDGTSTSSQTVTISINNVNEAPAVSAPAAFTVTEDVESTINGISITDVDAGSGNVTATFTAGSGTLSAFSGGGVTASGSAKTLSLTGTVADLNNYLSSGNLSFTAALNDTSTVTLTLSVNDGGNSGSGGAQDSGLTNITINVSPVNDGPSFTKGPDQEVAINAGLQEVSGWATDISRGPADEGMQTIAFNVNTDNPGLFSVPPQVSAEGTLTYTPASDTTGSANVTVTLQDSGGTDNGGTDTSSPQSFVIRVCSADGGGTLTTSTSSIAAGQTGVEVNFTYLADAGGLNNGALTITVPDGWSVPATNPVEPGYSTASTGVVAVSGRTITVSGITLAGGGSLALTYGDMGGGGPGATAATTPGAAAWQAKSKTTSSGVMTGLREYPEITVVPDTTDGDKSTVIADQTILAGDGSSTGVITVTLRDSYNNLISGQNVELLQGSGSSVITPATVVTDSNGQAVFNVHSVRAEMVTYVARDIAADVTVAQSAKVTFTGGVGVSPDSLSLNEGHYGEYSVMLFSQPTDSVTLSVYGSSQITVTPISLSFDETNWHIPQTVTITALDDYVRQGARDVTVSNTVYSSDLYYNNILADSVTVHITDNDTPGVSVVQSGGSTDVTEGANSDTYTIFLNTMPTDSVTARVYGGNQLEVNPLELRFTVDNWNIPQMVTVNAVEDTTAEGKQEVNINHNISSSDSDYNGISVPEVKVNITDNDTPGVNIIQSDGSTAVSEDGGEDSYTIQLFTRPSDSVTVYVYGDTQVQSYPESITFTRDTWNTEQTVTVKAVDDSLQEGNHTGTVTQAVYSYDADYANLVVPITVNITDNDYSTNGDLSLLTISSGTLSPAFDSAITEYTSRVAHSVTSITVTSVLQDSAATVKVNGQTVQNGNPSAPVALNVGNNTINVVVTAQDLQTIKTYRIVVSRAGSSGGHNDSDNDNDRDSEQTQQTINYGAEGKVNPAAGGTVGLEGEASVQIPAEALQGTGTVEVAMERVTSPPAVPSGFRVLGQVYEFRVNNQDHYNFNKQVTLTFTFDPYNLSSGEEPAVFYYDEVKGQWINIGGIVSGNTITVKVDHFTKYAVMIGQKSDLVLKPEPAVIFKDIFGHWAEGNINKLVGLGVISGYPDGTFRPDNSITRAEFAAILVSAFNLETEGTKIFADTTNHWAKEYISRAASCGLVAGYSDTVFGADDSLTREQMAAIIVRAVKLIPAIGEELNFIDKGSISVWAKDAVTTAVKNRIIGGYPDGTLRPQANTTRAEVVTVILKVLHK